MTPGKPNTFKIETIRPVRIAFRTTGCKVNQYDSGAVLAALSDLPVVVCDPDDMADIVVVNACTVTMNADRDGRAAAYRAARSGARVVVAGCLATRLEGQQASGALPDDILVIGGTADRSKLVAALRSMISTSDFGRGNNGAPGGTADYATLTPGRTGVADEDDEDAATGTRSRPLIKIQDGCDCRCSYCIVPLVRGPSRGAPLGDITAQVLAAAESGASEVVLTGVDLAAWGRRDDGRYGHLVDLIRHVTSLGTGMRFRLSSLEPHGLDDELVDAVASNRDVCPHLHIPMQAGSDAVLKRMNRPYSAKRFADLVGRASAAIPGLVLGMDVIVGFPGESETEFEDTRRMVEFLPTTYLHVFPYSPRPGTPAADAPDQVPDHTRRKRGKILRDIAAARRAAHAETLVGRDIEVVYVKPSESGAWALSADYTKVLVANRFDIAPGRRMIRITGARGACAIGIDANTGPDREPGSWNQEQ